MKLVKLNRRYSAYKEHGHRWAFRWDGYDPHTCHKVEKIFEDMHGSQYSWNPRTTNRWKSNFGYLTKRQNLRPFWVSFTDEQDATVVLLKLENYNE